MTSLKLCAQEATHATDPNFSWMPQASPVHSQGKLASKRLLPSEGIQARDLGVAGQDNMVKAPGCLLVAHGETLPSMCMIFPTPRNQNMSAES